MPVHDLFHLFVDPLEKGDVTYMVTGSVAAILYGEPRLTHDVDMILDLETEQVPALAALFPEPEYYCPPAEVIRIELGRRRHAHFNLIHAGSGLKADCYPDTGDPLHAWGLAHRRRMALDETRKAWIAPPEYVIVRKLEYFREGGSGKHLDDVRHMLETGSDTLDTTFLTGELEKKKLTDDWKKLTG